MKAMMFDFQTLRYASPMIDLSTFLANSTGTDVRSTHFSFIFKTYHEEVIKTLMAKLKKFRHEISECYRFAYTKPRHERLTDDRNRFNLHFIFLRSYDNFLREYARLSPYGFLIASSFLQILHDPEEVDFNNIDYSVGVEFFIQKAWRWGPWINAIIHIYAIIHPQTWRRSRGLWAGWLDIRYV